ncbi:MAG TPA: DUF799 family lipoprotein [Smithellaceae bacterium]|jgi:hypothetical protein|nr:DUF799 family lipoprotein [Smithellaceae bacterium]HQG79707.1 DUF799 family lipoprotein [Smithellaceae bacterium]
MARFFLIIITLASVLGCVTTPTRDYTKFNAAKPKSILIVPMVNRSVEITAPDYCLSTITIPLANRGYYVFPVNMVKRLLEDDGLSDANLVHNAPVEKLANLFGADAVLYVTINQWDAKYMVLTTQVTVSLSYLIKDGKTGDSIWEHNETMIYQPKSQSSGNAIADLIIMAANAAVTRAAPNYVPLARQANFRAFSFPGRKIPPGPYLLVDK